MIELASFKDTQSKVVTENSGKRQSDKIFSSEQESSDGQLTDFQRATGQRILTKGQNQRVMSNHDVLASKQPMAHQGSREPDQYPMSSNVSGLEMDAALSLSASNYDTQTQDAAKLRPGFQVRAGEPHHHGAQHRF